MDECGSAAAVVEACFLLGRKWAHHGCRRVGPAGAATSLGAHQRCLCCRGMLARSKPCRLSSASSGKVWSQPARVVCACEADGGEGGALPLPGGASDLQPPARFPGESPVGDARRRGASGLRGGRGSQRGRRGRHAATGHRASGGRALGTAAFVADPRGARGHRDADAWDTSEHAESASGARTPGHRACADGPARAGRQAPRRHPVATRIAPTGVWRRPPRGPSPTRNGD